METSQQFIEFLKSCITPVALISGVGLLLLTVTNRLGRSIDRTRHLINELDNPNVARKANKQDEIQILYKRSRYLRNSIGAIIISIIASSLIIPMLFLMYLYALDLRAVGYFLFVVAMLSILVSCIFFFKDITLSLEALRIEAEDHL
ncbi:MAG: DUF2721 domain-containing protein [Bacteroidales bacterium]|nr:DUF2721 domain-containing protein [Bacteroidales bacterium]